MMKILQGLRIVEGTAFVAAPLAGMTLAQMGADVIRFDRIRGGLDHHRWPVTHDNKSLFWAGLNKGKRSLAVDVEYAARAGDRHPVDLRSRPEYGHFSDQSAGARLDGLRASEAAPRRPDHADRAG
jgi:hypothetical protein